MQRKGAVLPCSTDRVSAGLGLRFVARGDARSVHAAGSPKKLDRAIVRAKVPESALLPVV